MSRKTRLYIFLNHNGRNFQILSKKYETFFLSISESDSNTWNFHPNPIVSINSNHKMTFLAYWIVFHWFIKNFKILIFLGQHFEVLAIVQTRNIKDNPMVFLGQKTHEKSSSLTSLGAVFKVIHHKYSTINSYSGCLSLFWPQKVYLEYKIDSFLSFMLINF